MPFIYKIVNKINGKCYIGKTMFTIQERWKEHCNDCQKDRYQNRPLYRAIRKYGIENFEISEVETCSDLILSERERYWINYYDTYRNGYNATVGGDGTQYVDYDLVVRIYELTHNQKETAKIVGIDIATVKNILNIRNVKLASGNQVINKVCGKNINMFSLNGEKLISGAAAHISSVCKGNRKTAYHYRWSYL